MLFNAIINPYRQRLSDYAEESNKQFVAGGLTFHGSHFAGAYGGGAYPVRGQIFAAEKDDACYLILMQSPANTFEVSMKQFNDALKTCKFH